MVSRAFQERFLEVRWQRGGMLTHPCPVQIERLLILSRELFLSVFCAALADPSHLILRAEAKDRLVLLKRYTTGLQK